MENAARIQISYDGDLQRVVVRSDHNNRGYYDECFSAKVNLPAEWWRNAYIGVSASTGDLADNHDVLEISTVVGVSRRRSRGKSGKTRFAPLWGVC